MVDETRVRYKAIADFTALGRSIRTAKRNLKELREEEAKLNRESVLGSARATVANNKRADSVRNLTNATQGQGTAIQKSTVAFVENANAAKQAQSAQSGAAKSTKEAATATQGLGDTTRRAYREMLNAKNAADGLGRSVRNAGTGFRSTRREMTTTMSVADRLTTSFRRLGNWRPRLTPPFIALIPIIAGVLGLINPLVAGLGAVGAAGLGFASSLGSIAGAALTAVPALFTLLSVVGALKTAFGGIGGAFSAFKAAKTAGGGGGGGGGGSQRAELTQQEEITRAQERYARSLQDVKWAEEDLDAARADYLTRLREIRKEVERTAASEAAAAADVQLARENYANVLADPGSTKGEKMAAKAALEESQQELQDLREENEQLRKDLAKMEKDGPNGDRAVIQAQRALTDAMWAQRDAQLALINAQNGVNEAMGGGGGGAANAFQDALNKLSPSARRFVETILAMDEAWTNLKRNVQERFFSKFVDDVWRLQLLFGPLESLLGNAADALGRFARNFILLVTSPEWQRDIILFGEGNVPIIDAMGDGVLSLLDGLRNLALAGQPALLRLARGFERGAEGLSEMIASAREDGSLAAFLDRSIDRLSQWWRIVKNIGRTIFNYSQAAGDFSQGLTDGLEKITEGWLESSETALGPNSKFKQYLEDIEPLVSEIKGLFADFFSWFARVSADPKNIGQMTEMIQHIRDNLGPAISTLLQQLADAEIGPKFVDSITKIVEIITSLANSPATEVFFNVLNALLGVAKWVVSNPILGSLLGTLATGFAAIAAVSLVGKFTGVTSLIGWLLKLAKGGTGLPKLLSGILGALGMGGIIGGGTVAKGGATAAGVAAAGTRRGAGGGGLGAGPAVLPGQTRAQYRASAGGGKGFNLLGSIGKGAGKGVGIGAVASIVGTILGDLISSSSAEGAAGSGQRVGGNALAGAASGAGLGALLGSIVPGLGTAIGAAIGGVVGGGAGLATSSPEDIEQMLSDWGDFFGTVGEWIAGVSQEFWRWLTVDLPAWVGSVADGFMTWLTVDIPTWLASVGEGFMLWLTVDLPAWLASIAEGFYNWLTIDLPFALGFAAGLFWNWLTVDMPAWLATVWDGFMTWLTVDMPAWLAGVWQGFMTWLTVDLPAWIASAAAAAWKWLTVDVPAWIASAASAFWNWLTVQVPGYIATAAGAFWNWLTVDIPNNIATAADSFWRFLTVDIPNWIGDAADAFWNWLTVDIPNAISNMVGDFWGNLTAGFTAGSEQNKNNGGVIRRAGGGGVPGSGNSDTVPAMLTPGEFVVRKEIVSRVGAENLAKFNSGVMSYAQMIQQANKDKQKKSGSGGGFGGLQMLNAGGLVPDIGFFGGEPPRGGPSLPGDGGYGGSGGDAPIIGGDVIINNPAPEPASDSLPRTIRKMAYLGGRR